MPVLHRDALEASPLADLHAIASELGIDGFRRLRKAELIDRILRDLDRLEPLGRPLLLAVSRKYFLGAITGRPPAERLAGTLAAAAWAVDAGAAILRVHDVAAVRDVLAVKDVLAGRADVPAFDAGDEELKWIRADR